MSENFPRKPRVFGLRDANLLDAWNTLKEFPPPEPENHMAVDYWCWVCEAAVYECAAGGAQWDNRRSER